MAVKRDKAFDDVKHAFVKVVGVEEVKRAAQRALEQGVSPVKIIEKMREGLKIAGEKYEAGEFFLSELIMVGMMAGELADMLKPYLLKSETRTLGRVAIGTVKGDLHDIGKGIVATMLSSIGFSVSDLGVDVSADRFVDVVKSEAPDIVALSCLLTIAMDEMKGVIEELEKAGVRRDVKVLVGGRPITKEFAEEIGADGYGSDAIEAMKIAKELMGR